MAQVGLALALPVLAWTYKSTYLIPCSDIWRAVKEALSNPDHYAVLENEEPKCPLPTT
jgi:hypothetical protein